MNTTTTPDAVRRRIGSRPSRHLVLALLGAFALVVAGCGDDDDAADEVEPSPTTAPADDGESTVNACPEDGCTITIDDIATSGDELTITWSTNFAPDVARNHVHVYWDNFTAAEVSSDAAANGLEQGKWVPTDASPEFVTEGAVSMAERGESTTVCVTAADREHAVMDTALVDCRDIGDLIG